HFNPARILAELADALDEFNRELRGRRRIQCQRCASDWFAANDEFLPPPADPNAVLADILSRKLGRRRLAPIPMEQQIHTATRTAGDNTHQPLSGGLREVGWEIRHDQEMVFLGNYSGLFIVLRYGLIFVAQVHLDDLLHVLVEVRQALL